MNFFKTQKDLKNYLKPFQQERLTVGFVPTMGALHQGHLSLLERSLSENQITVISIFVNPTQFNNLEDLEKYPRTIDEDLKKIRELNQEIIVYAPEVEDIYGEDVNSQSFDYDGLEHQMEGKQRPGHFDGVGTVVKRLLEVVTPNKAYFGEKDYQQVLIVQKMVQKHRLPVEIIMCPIVREPNGLAMSSRNQRLSSQEREKASFIYQTLFQAKELFAVKELSEVTDFVKKAFEEQSIIKLEYFTITDSQTLIEASEKKIGKKYRAFVAVFIGNVRLIDTIALN